MDYIDLIRERKADRLCVCSQCLQAIESHEGNQIALAIFVDEEDEENSRCDWCGESGFDELYEIQ